MKEAMLRNTTTCFVSAHIHGTQFWFQFRIRSNNNTVCPNTRTLLGSLSFLPQDRVLPNSMASSFSMSRLTSSRSARGLGSAPAVLLHPFVKSIVLIIFDSRWPASSPKGTVMEAIVDHVGISLCGCSSPSAVRREILVKRSLSSFLARRQKPFLVSRSWVTLRPGNSCRRTAAGMGGGGGGLGGVMQLQARAAPSSVMSPEGSFR